MSFNNKHTFFLNVKSESFKIKINFYRFIDKMICSLNSYLCLAILAKQLVVYFLMPTSL